jgi:hypothetical protein
MPEFNRTLQPDISLHRQQDTRKLLGDPSNKNTMLANLYLTSNAAIQMNNSGKIQLTNNSTTNSLTIQNGSLMASTLQATEPIPSGTPCSSSQLGAVGRQGDNLATGAVQSNVVCTYNPAVCPNQANSGGSEYCYLPILNNTITFNNNSSNWMGESFVCPGTTPYAINGVGGGTVTLQEYYDIYHVALLTQQHLICQRHDGVNNNVCQNINSNLPTPLAVVGAPEGNVSTQVPAQFITAYTPNQYKVNIGYSVTPTNTSCQAVCNLLPSIYSQAYKCYYANVPPFTFTNAATNQQFCWCQQETTSLFLCQLYQPLNAPYVAVQVMSNAAQIQSVTCTSKAVFSAN